MDLSMVWLIWFMDCAWKQCREENHLWHNETKYLRLRRGLQ
jgi:hypothetical protein